MTTKAKKNQVAEKREDLIAQIEAHPFLGYAENSPFNKTHVQSLENLSLHRLKEILEHGHEMSPK